MTGTLPVRPSTVTLPRAAPAGVATLLDFFAARFPAIPVATWAERFAVGKVWSAAGPVRADDPFSPGLVLHYRREVAAEPEVRRDWRLVWRDEHLLVVDKPPFLPVTPGGRWVRHCLLHLLAEALDERELAPLHRLDRLTSGLVVVARRTESRGHYSRLFQGLRVEVEKVYTAVVEPTVDPPQRVELAHHIARSTEEHWRQVAVAGAPVNARSTAELVATDGVLAVYRVVPRSGRKHQLRVQLAAAGLPVVNDPLYGLRPHHDPHDLRHRLGLDAARLTVRAFPAWGGGELTVEWSSGRSVGDLLAEVEAEADDRDRG